MIIGIIIGVVLGAIGMLTFVHKMDARAKAIADQAAEAVNKLK